MDQVTLVVVRAVESGATTTKAIIDATGLSRLKVDRALNALEKQKLLFRHGQGSWALGIPVTPTVRECGTLAVTKLDRLARSMPDTLVILGQLSARDVRFVLSGSKHEWAGCSCAGGPTTAKP